MKAKTLGGLPPPPGTVRLTAPVSAKTPNEGFFFLHYIRFKLIIINTAYEYLNLCI